MDGTPAPLFDDVQGFEVPFSEAVVGALPEAGFGVCVEGAFLCGPTGRDRGALFRA